MSVHAGVQRVLVSVPQVHVEALTLEERLGVLEELLGRNVEDKAMDWLELQAWVVDVHQLHQREARRVVVGRTLPLELLPAALGGGQRVVPIAHGKEQDPVIPIRTVALAEELWVRQAPQPSHHALDGLPRRDAVAGEAACTMHELKVVDLLVHVPVLHQGLDDRLLWVVDEHQDVRQLHGRFLADGDSRREAVLDGLLCGADERLRALLEGVQIQVQLHQEAVA
mmetsp:Transcript_74166/g.191327  ORF Transcript_74166/g.191327 Transcript_74166/m.191327 type:complete len:225 (+) Transcript_74166:648-1322(+)